MDSELVELIQQIADEEGITFGDAVKVAIEILRNNRNA